MSLSFLRKLNDMYLVVEFSEKIQRRWVYFQEYARTVCYNLSSVHLIPAHLSSDQLISAHLSCVKLTPAQLVTARRIAA